MQCLPTKIDGRWGSGRERKRGSKACVVNGVVIVPVLCHIIETTIGLEVFEYFTVHEYLVLCLRGWGLSTPGDV